MAIKTAVKLSALLRMRREADEFDVARQREFSLIPM
jgi:hypothetical protein